MLGNNCVKRIVDVNGHAGRITANEEIAPLFEPLEQLCTVFGHAVLDVHLLILIAAKGRVDSREQAIGDESLQFGLVEIVT